MLEYSIDYYKFTMSQLYWQLFRKHDLELTFTWKHRDTDRLVSERVDPQRLQDRLNVLSRTGFSTEAIRFLEDQRLFSPNYLIYLGTDILPFPKVGTDERGELTVEVTGPAWLVTFWETIIMAEISQEYFRQEYLYTDESYRRLAFKTDYLSRNPHIAVAEFGTRRRISEYWQEEVIGKLASKSGVNLLGTSNVGMANQLGLRPIGTFAHELPMVYAAMAQIFVEDLRESHSQMLRDWETLYGERLSIALSDTFTSDFFLLQFEPFAQRWTGTRQDSGDPIAYGEKMIEFYESVGIDPTTKLILFSDNLKIGPDHNDLEMIDEHFRGRIRYAFGVGTNLTNDISDDVKPLNQVMKVSRVDLPSWGQAYTVKLSDDVAKASGPPEVVQQYKDIFCA